VAYLYDALAALYDAKEGKLYGHQKYSQAQYDVCIARMRERLERIAGASAVKAFDDLRRQA
jgi:hypothetical protein